MRVLIGCEESGIVRRAFAALGHDAWSCDLIPSADGSNRLAFQRLDGKIVRHRKALKAPSVPNRNRPQEGQVMADEALAPYGDKSQFRPIIGYPGYLAAASGEIVSLKSGSPRVMARRPHRGGYVLVTLCDGNGGQTTQTAHRVIASAFHPNPKSLPCVRHIDGDKKNNRAIYLAWGTYADNEADKIATGTRRYGTANMKLRLADRDEVRAAFDAGATRADLAMRFGVDRSTISRLLSGATWINRKWPISAKAAQWGGDAMKGVA